MSVSEKERKHRRWSKSSVASYVTQSAEPIMFLHAVSAFLVSTVYSSLRLDKVCRVGSDWFGNGEVSTSRFCLPIFSSFLPFPSQAHLILKTSVTKLTMAIMMMNKIMFKRLQTTCPQLRHMQCRFLPLYLS